MNQASHNGRTPGTEHTGTIHNGTGKAVVFENVSLRFDELVVLDGLSFELEHGATKVLLGVAGSGKTTILKLTLGLLRPDSGRIFVLGQEVTAMRETELFELRRRIGMVFQESALFDSLSVESNVAFRLLEEKVAEEEIHRRVLEALRFVELEHTIDAVSVRTLRRHEKAGGNRPRHYFQPRSAALRFSHRGTRPGDFDHHRRTAGKTARRIQDQRAAGDPPSAGCVHHGDAPLQPRAEQDGPGASRHRTGIRRPAFWY